MLHSWKRAAALMLALCLCLFGTALADQGLTTYDLGAEVEDFTLTACDGQTLTLSELLKEKDLVFLTLRSTFKGTSWTEVFALQEAYAAYQEDVAVIALTDADAHTDEELRAYAEQQGLTFPLARDTASLAYRFNVSGIATGVVIDRFGRVGCLYSGLSNDTDAYARLFDAFLGETYTQTRPLESIPAMRPNIPKAEVAKLAEALDTSWALQNPSDVYVWPMIPAEVDDRLCLMSTNSSMDNTQSLITATLEAKQGDALTVTFRLSSEMGYDFFQIGINGETVKVFSGERDWMTYAWEVPADGAYTLSLCYDKDAQDSVGEDLVSIDSVSLLSGEEASVALAANPVYPAGDATALTLVTEGARRIVFDDPTFALSMMFGLAEYYIVPGDSADFHATLDAALDPEGAFFSADGSITSAVSAMAEDGYRVNVPITEGYSTLTFVPAQDSLPYEVKTAVVFSGEESIQALMDLLAEYGMAVNGWQYAD